MAFSCATASESTWTNWPVTLATHYPAQFQPEVTGGGSSCDSDETSLEALASSWTSPSCSESNGSEGVNLDLDLFVEDATWFFTEDGQEARTPPSIGDPVDPHFFSIWQTCGHDYNKAVKIVA
eukprot:3397723-Amphidinium_carterae.1